MIRDWIAIHISFLLRLASCIGNGIYTSQTLQKDAFKLSEAVWEVLSLLIPGCGQTKGNIGLFAGCHDHNKYNRLLQTLMSYSSDVKQFADGNTISTLDHSCLGTQLRTWGNEAPPKEFAPNIECHLPRDTFLKRPRRPLKCSRISVLPVPSTPNKAFEVLTSYSSVSRVHTPRSQTCLKDLTCTLDQQTPTTCCCWRSP